MNVTLVLNLHTLVFVPLLVAFLLALPRITRKGLLFGVYVGEDAVGAEPARRLVRAWLRWIWVLLPVALGLGLGLGLSGHARAGNTSALLLVFGWSAVLYLVLYRATRRLVPADRAPATVAAAPLVVEPPVGRVVARVALGICLLAGVLTVGHAAAAYDDLPLRMPTHFDAQGQPDAWAERTWPRVLGMPLLTLGTGFFFGVAGLLVAGAKRSVRGGTGGHSLEAQREFRRQFVNRARAIAVLGTLALAWLSVQITRIGLSETHRIGTGVLWVAGLGLVHAFGSLAVIMVRLGQGGALREAGSSAAPLTDGLADDRHWVWGAFYVNREDPSLLVEGRFGLGYMFNFGNWRAVTILLVMVAALAVPMVVLFGIAPG